MIGFHVEITEEAANKVKDLIIKENSPDTLGLRLKATGGGCSGISFELSLDKLNTGDILEDNTVENHGVKIFIDEQSSLYVDGCKIDYQKTIMSEGFVITNSKKRGCGCGKSFET